MQQLTKQEMQSAMQKMSNTILSQAVTKQDINRIASNIAQQSSAQLQSDMPRVLNQFGERVLDKACQDIKQQNSFIMQLNTKLDNAYRKLTENEQRLMKLEYTLARLQQQLESASGLVESIHFRQSATNSSSGTTAEPSQPTKRVAFGGLFG